MKNQNLRHYLQKEKKVQIKWDSFKDEVYTYFGKCECGENSVIVGSKYCNACGYIIENPLQTK